MIGVLRRLCGVDVRRTLCSVLTTMKHKPQHSCCGYYDRNANANSALLSKNHELSRQVETQRKQRQMMATEELRLALKHCRDSGLTIDEVKKIINERFYQI